MPVNNKIKIRRGNNIDLPAGGTESGELRYSIDTKELYIDDGSLNIKIGGDPYAFPVSTATQSALNGKQASGTYSTDIHGNITALNAVSNTNTGDETLLSIKTKLGAASAVSDGYLTSNMFNVFNNSEPSFTKNTAFNKNFGTTTGTVLEGRTFGTAANSAVGDFQPIENQRLSTTNSPSFNRLTSTVATGTAPLTVNSTTMVGNLNCQFINGTNLSRIISEKGFGARGLYIQNNTVSWLNSAIDGAGGITSWTGNFLSFGENDISYKTQFLISKTDFKFRGTYGDEDTQFNTLYHSGNLTNTLSTNYIPKWNGSNFVNSLISDVAGKVGISTSARVKLEVNSDLSLPTDLSSAISSGTLLLSDGGNIGTVFGNYDNTGGVFYKGYVQSRLNADASTPLDFHIEPLGGNTLIGINSTSYYTKILSTTPSTAPTNGALVVGGGVGADHVRANNFYGNGSNLTGVQLPITLTTKGTSGAATFSGNVLNVPNYTSTGIGGSYTASISSGSNTANPVVYSSLYTKNGTVYSSIIKGYIECTGSQGNTCTFNVSTYNGSTANLSIIGVGAQGTNIILGSGSTGSNVVMSFTNPVGSGGIGFTLIIHYTN